MARMIRWMIGLGGSVLLVACQNAVADPLSAANLTGPAVSATAPNYQDVNQGAQLFSRGDFAGALARLQAAKKASPELPPADAMMAQLHFSAGQNAAGYASLEKAMRDAPDDPEPYVMLIERAAAEGRLTEADLLYPEAQKRLKAFAEDERRKKNLESRVYLVGAAIDESQQKFAQAQAKLEALIKLDENNAAAHQRLGRVLNAESGADSQRRAFAEFERAAELDPKALPADLMMAMLAKEPSRAEQWINRAVQQKPNDLRTQLGAADFWLKQGKLDTSREHVAAALKLDPTGFDANLLAGLEANLSGDYTRAIEYLSLAHLLQPSNPAVVNQLTFALLESPNEADRTRAVQFAEMNARMQPDNIEQQAALAWVYFRQQRMADAERAFKAVFNRPAGAPLNVSGDASFILATIAAAQGNTKDALRLLKPVLDSKQLFVYRARAEELQAKLAKDAPPSAATPSGTGTTP